jgi:hypothetical protein
MLPALVLTDSLLGGTTKESFVNKTFELRAADTLTLPLQVVELILQPRKKFLLELGKQTALSCANILECRRAHKYV